MRKSSGQGLTPTPKEKRFWQSTATDAACFATSTHPRTGSFTTKVEKRSLVVTAAIAGISVNGSRIGLPSRNSRLPSAL